MKLAGGVSLVTGSARRLGKQIAVALAGRGSSIAVHHGASKEAAGETVGELRALGVEAAAFAADLARPAEIDGLFRQVADRFGRLDVLVNSAASFERGAFEAISAEEWDAVLGLNLRAPFLCLQRAIRLMRGAARSGAAPAAVVNIADLSGLVPWSDQAHHGASKAGLLHLTRLAARDLAPDVRVNAVVPGPILPPPGMDLGDPEWRRTVERLPLARAGEPAEVGAAVVFLAENDFITGTTLLGDGGASCSSAIVALNGISDAEAALLARNERLVHRCGRESSRSTTPSANQGLRVGISHASCRPRSCAAIGRNARGESTLWNR